MMMKWRGWALATGVLAVSAMAQAAPPTAAMLSNACAGCHGTNGGSAGPTMPSLASQSKEAIRSRHEEIQERRASFIDHGPPGKGL
jgi:cytochrome c553